MIMQVSETLVKISLCVIIYLSYNDFKKQLNCTNEEIKKLRDINSYLSNKLLEKMDEVIALRRLLKDGNK